MKVTTFPGMIWILNEVARFMRKLSVMNYKGGTGKTCTVVNLAHGLALKGHRVLIVDTDPQGSAGYHLGVKARYSLYDVLMAQVPLAACIMRARPNLDIICSNERLYPAELAIARLAQKELVLKSRLSAVAGYDYIILDSSPSMNLLNQNSLLFSEELIIPVSMEYLSLVGVKQLLKNIKIINKIFKRDIRITRVVPTFFDKRNKKSKDILDSLNRVFPGFIATAIRNNVALSEAPGYKNTIFEYDPGSPGVEDYFYLVDEVIKNGKKAI